jgi:hypothetical protein
MAMSYLKKNILIILMLSSILLGLPVTTSAFEKTGTTAATFLQIPSGARLPAMGGAGVAISGGPELLSFNPALVDGKGTLGISLSYIDWFAGLDHQSASFVFEAKPNLQLGLNIISFNSEEFEQSTLQQQEGTGVMVEYGDLAFGTSAIMQLTDRFTLGMTGKYIHQKLYNETASAFAFDIGTHLITSLEGFTIGMAMNNLGGEMQLDGRDLIVETGGISGGSTKLETRKWPLPLTFRTGIAWQIFGNENAYKTNKMQSLLIAADARHLNEGVTTVHLGGEYGFANTVFIRTGRTLNHDSEEWSFGAGINTNIYDWIVHADIAYADLGELDSIRRVTITVWQRNH